MKTKWYTGTQADVQAYIDALNGSDLLPIEDGAYRMEKWCEDATLTADGSYCCPQPPTEALNHFGIPQATQDAIKEGLVTGKLTLVDSMPELPEPEGME